MGLSHVVLVDLNSSKNSNPTRQIVSCENDHVSFPLASDDSSTDEGQNSMRSTKNLHTDVNRNNDIKANSAVPSNGRPKTVARESVWKGKSNVNCN